MSLIRRPAPVTLSFATMTFLLLTLGFNPTCLFRIGPGKMREGTATMRRRLGGLGSSPPTCRSKCGRCTPCRAVNVPIQPAFNLLLEYYPEAWRCKCGNHVFMP